MSQPTRIIRIPKPLTVENTTDRDRETDPHMCGACGAHILDAELHEKYHARASNWSRRVGEVLNLVVRSLLARKRGQFPTDGDSLAISEMPGEAE